MNKWIKIFTLMLLCSSLIIAISSCNKDEDIPAEVTNLALKNVPTIMNYYEGDILDLSGLVITITRDNGESKDIAFLDFESNGIACLPLNGTELVEELTQVIITHTASGKSVSQVVSYMIVTDADDNAYQVVKIDEQFWMAENLKTSKYNDGTAITLETDNTAWSNLTSSAYCWYNNDQVQYAEEYGALYNWHCVETGNLCPEGWHVPSDTEWKTLEVFIGMTEAEADEYGYRGTDEGGKLKEVGFIHWLNPNTGATDYYGFSALPSGYRENSDGIFNYIGDNGPFWSSTPDGYGGAWSRRIHYSSAGIGRARNSIVSGFAVRCIMD
jgi:uncharacterized protein (TIGR02145 family)